MSELTPWPHYKTDPPANAKARGEALKALGEGIAALDRVAPEGKRVARAVEFEAAGVTLEDAPVPPPPPTTAPTPSEAPAP